MSGRTIARALACLLPMSEFKRKLLNLLGYNLAPGSYLGPNLVWKVDRIDLAAGSSIWLGNVLRDLRLVELGAKATLGQWNWATGSRAFAETEYTRIIRVGAESAVTSRHYLDATGGITIGAFSGIGGVRSTLLTHGVDYMESKQTSDPIVIGDYALINSNCVIIAGTVVQDRVIVGAHSLVAGTLKSGGVYVTGPGRRVREVDAAFFNRTVGFISTGDEPGPAIEPSSAP